MGKLDGKVAVVTGSANERGMGYETVKRFIKEGAKVVIADVKEDEGTKFAEELGENALFIKLNVADEHNWQDVISKTEEQFGTLDILINCAGISINASPTTEDTDVEDFRKVLEVNLVGTFLGMKYAIPSMKRNGKGSIVNISSAIGQMAMPNNSAYVASKFGVRGISKVAALELAENNIRVNSVHPGFVATQMLLTDDLQQGKDTPFTEMIPMKRLADAKELTNMIFYLASDDASYSTGSEYTVDGGLTPF